LAGSEPILDGVTAPAASASSCERIEVHIPMGTPTPRASAQMRTPRAETSIARTSSAIRCAPSGRATRSAGVAPIRHVTIPVTPSPIARLAQRRTHPRRDVLRGRLGSTAVSGTFGVSAGAVTRVP